MDTEVAIELFGHRGDPFAGHARYQRVASALKIVGIGKSKLYDLIRKGRITAKKLDNITYIDLASVAALFAKCPQIAPLQHNVVTAEQLGITEAELPAEEIAQEAAFKELCLDPDDFAQMEEERS